jgi:hypothetical protein
VDITDATGTKTEIQEGVLEDTVEVDKDETDEEYMMKQDEALFNRENVPDVRTDSQRKPNCQHSKNWRLEKLMLMLLMLQVDVVMARDNLGQGQVDTSLFGQAIQLPDSCRSRPSCLTSSVSS